MESIVNDEQLTLSVKEHVIHIYLYILNVNETFRSLMKTSIIWLMQSVNKLKYYNI